MPIRSNSGPGEYNPWADLNGDGTVDILDAILLANAYGTSGTPMNRTETLADLQPRVDRIEQFFNQTAPVEFLYVSGGGPHVPHYALGIVGFWNASRLVAESMTDKINSTISGLRNCTL